MFTSCGLLACMLSEEQDLVIVYVPKNKSFKVHLHLFLCLQELCDTPVFISNGGSQEFDIVPGKLGEIFRIPFMLQIKSTN